MLFLVSVLVLSAIVVSVPKREVVERNRDIAPHFYGYSYGYVESIAEDLGFGTSMPILIERGRTGSEVLVFAGWGNEREPTALTLTGSGGQESVMVTKAPFPTGEYGCLVDLEQGDILAVEASGSVCLVQRDGKLIAVGCSRDNHRCELDDVAGLSNFRVFRNGNLIHVFATAFEESRDGGVLNHRRFTGIKSYVCKVDKDGFTLDNLRTFPRPTTPRATPFHVEDMDPWSNQVLVRDPYDMPFAFRSSWYVFNVDDADDADMVFVARTNGYGVFLQADVLSAFKDGLLRQSPAMPAGLSHQNQ